MPVDPPRPPVEQPVTVYHAQPHGNRTPLRQMVMPDLYVDVSSVMDQKKRMLACHQSQRAWLDESQGMGSYLAAMEGICREIGAMSGQFEVAEGWRRRLHFGFCKEDADPLVEALGEYVYVFREEEDA